MIKIKTALTVALVMASTSAFAGKAPTNCTNASGRTIKQQSETCPSGFTAQPRTPTPTTPDITAAAVGPAKPTLSQKPQKPTPKKAT
jgi:hypothetical protein